MSITAGAILLITIWFLTLFIVLQVTTHTQGEAGEVVPGTHEGAPHDFRARKALLITTLIALPIWGVTVAIILSGWITVHDLDWMGVLDDIKPN